MEKDSAAAPREGFLNERRPSFLVGIAFLLHSLGLALLFDPIGGLFDARPVLEQDWGLHFHHLVSMAAFWRTDGMLWGYNPLFMAGYPSNTIQDLSIKLFELLSLPSTRFGFEPIRAFKLAVFISTAAIPWMLYFTARNLFAGPAFLPWIAPTAVIIGTAYWWNSLPREMFFYGMVGFPPAVYLALFALSLLHRITDAGAAVTRINVAWLLALSAMVPLHVQSLVIFLPPALALLLMKFRSLDRRTLLWLAAGAVVPLLVNLPWIVPFLSHLGDDVSGSIVAQLPLFTSLDPATFLKDYLSPKGYWTFRSSIWEKGLRWLLLIVGSAGLARLIIDQKRHLGIALACGAVFLFLFSYFGSLLPSMGGWQPLRFKIACDLFLVFAAAYFINIHEREGRSRAKLLSRIALLCGAIAFSVNLIQTESARHMRLRTRVPPEIEAIAEWVRSEAPIDGRLLFEESGDETGFFYKGIYLSSFLPHWTERQLIGGPINLYNDRHHFAEFHSGIFFQRDIMSFTDEALRAYFRHYNIGAVIAFHPRSIQRLLAFPDLISVERRIGQLHLMKVKQPLAWILKGEGEIAAGLNRLRGSRIRGNEIILKYHWIPGLVSDPPTKIVQERVLDDPIPFIKIIDPPAAFILRTGGGLPQAPSA